MARQPLGLLGARKRACRVNINDAGHVKPLEKRPQRRESPVHGTARVLRLLKLTEIPAQLPVRRMQGVDAHTLRPRRIVAKVDAIGAQRVLRAVALGPIRFYEPLDQRAYRLIRCVFLHVRRIALQRIASGFGSFTRHRAHLQRLARPHRPHTKASRTQPALRDSAQGRPGLARHRRHSARACCEYAATRAP